MESVNSAKVIIVCLLRLCFFRRRCFFAHIQQFRNSLNSDIRTFATMQQYPAKLLLFGEHLLLLGASALAVPVHGFALTPRFGGKNPAGGEMLQKLKQFAESTELASVAGMDKESFISDLENGLYFESDIPAGYGLGSSGALCAAVYDRYCREKSADPTELKSVFARMESFFHGSSSGIDPLTSYLGKPLLIRHKTEVSVAEMKPWASAPVIFLLDTRMPRHTGPLVQWFIERSREPAFAKKLEEQLLPAHETMVRAWLNAEAEAFWAALKGVSVFQLHHFQPMIPDVVRPLWVESEKSGEFCLKICGAGGGGYVLGFARSRATAVAAGAGFPVLFPFDLPGADTIVHPTKHPTENGD